MFRSIRTVVSEPSSLTISFIFAVHSLLSGNWLARLPEIQHRLALSEGELGLTLLGMPAGAVLIMPFTGWIANRWGAGRVTFITALLLCTVTLLPPLAGDMSLLVLAFFLLGVTGGALDIAMNAEAAAIEEARGEAILSTCHGFYSLGAMIGAATGGLVAAAGIPLPLHITGVVLALAVLVIVRRGTLLRGAAASAPASGPAFALPTRPLMGLAVIAFCVLLGEGAMADWSAVYLRNTLGAGAAVAGFGYAVFSLAMTVGRLYGDEITRRVPPALLVGGGGLLAAVGLGIALLSFHPYVALAGFLCVGFGFAAVVPIVYRAAAQAPGMAPGAGIAAVATAGYAGLFIGPPLIGLTAEAVGLRGALGVVVVLSVLIAAIASRALQGSTRVAPAVASIPAVVPSKAP